MEAISTITRFEAIARISQTRIAELGEGILRDRAVAGLARLDQIIAKRKDVAGYLGQDDCSYLNETIS